MRENRRGLTAKPAFSIKVAIKAATKAISGLFPRNRWMAGLGTGLLLITPLASQAQSSQSVRWEGGNTFKNWSDPANWNPQIAPTKTPETRFTVTVPANTSLVYDLDESGAVDVVSFESQSWLQLTNGQPLEVVSRAQLLGTIEATGSGSAFLALTNNSQLATHPRLYASGGGYIGIGASTYNWAPWNVNAVLLQSLGGGSLVDLKDVTSMYVSGGTGTRTYSIAARTNGVIDLSRVGQITGPGGTHWLELNIDSGGDIRLGALGRTSARVRFNIDLPSYELPALNQASDTMLNIGPDSSLGLPILGSFSSGTISVGSNSVVTAPSLLSLDAVALTLTENGSFAAPNLSTYRNSDIMWHPDREAVLGPLNNIFASRLTASGGGTGRVAATSYDMHQDWRSSPTIFSAFGPGSLLDLSTLQSVTAWGGYGGS